MDNSQLSDQKISNPLSQQPKVKQKLLHIVTTRFSLSFLALFLFLLGFVGTFLIASFVGEPNSNKKNVVAHAKPIVAAATDKMTDLEYKQVKDKLTDIVMTQNPKSALTKLHTLTNIDPKVIEYCHSLSHEIGHASYKKYGFEDALSFQDDVCGSGYVHGVIESYFVDTQDLENKLHTVCSSGILTRESGNCYHGIGHGLMYYTGNNIPLSLQYCDSFTNLPQRSLCSEGVFMENFNSDIELHPSKYLHPSDPSYPCASQTTFYKDACYFYATDYYLHLHHNDYKGAIKWCDSVEKDFVYKCDMGVGSRTMKYNTGSPKFVEDVCMSAHAKEKVTSCIDGMISYFLVQYNSVSRAKNLCDELSKDNQTPCYQGVNNRSINFQN